MGGRCLPGGRRTYLSRLSLSFPCTDGRSVYTRREEDLPLPPEFIFSVHRWAVGVYPAGGGPTSTACVDLFRAPMGGRCIPGGRRTYLYRLSLSFPYTDGRS